MKKVLLIFILFTVWLFFFESKVNAATVFSTDFESGSVDPWVSSGGSATALISSELVKSGTFSLEIQHNKTSSYGFQTVVPNLESDMYYKVSAYGKTPDLNVAGFLVRVAWYQSMDGTGSQISTDDSNSGSPGSSDWQPLTQVVHAPNNANSAKIRLAMSSKSSGTMAITYFDDVSFEEYTQTPGPTSTPTPTPTSTPTKTSTPSPTKTPTPTPAKTPKPTSIPSESPLEQLSSGSGTVLGFSSVSPSPTASQSPDTKNKSSVLAFVLIGTGIVFIGASLYLGLKAVKHPQIQNDI